MQGEPEQGQDIVVELVNRVRILESKYSLMSERLLVVNQNMIEHHKKLMKDFKAGEMEIKDLKNDLEKVKNILKHLSEEAANFARKDEIKLLEKYIKMWNPINFITETDVKNLLQRELRRIEEGKALAEPAEVKKVCERSDADFRTPVRKEPLKKQEKKVNANA